MVNALKEWAVTVRALAAGDQTVTLRKGGIHEPDRHFALTHRRFFLYPTFDHQRADLISAAYLPSLEETLADGTWAGGQTPDALGAEEVPLPRAVTLRAWAEVAASYEVTEPEAVEALTPFHIWTSEYAEKRLKWKKRHPLHIMLLRVHHMREPATVTAKPEYAGCKSWIELDEDLRFEGPPVLTDQEFEQRAQAIERFLQGTSGTIVAAAP